MKPLLLLGLALPGFAGDIICTQWQAAPIAQRIGYIQGFAEGAVSGAQISRGDPAKVTQALPFGLSKAPNGGNDEIRRGIDAYCARPEKAPLQVNTLIVRYAGKVHGVSPEEIERFAAELRRRAASTPQKDRNPTPAPSGPSSTALAKELRGSHFELNGSPVPQVVYLTVQP